jgi:hypothetical protein
LILRDSIKDEGTKLYLVLAFIQTELQ